MKLKELFNAIINLLGLYFAQKKIGGTATKKEKIWGLIGAGIIIGTILFITYNLGRM